MVFATLASASVVPWGAPWGGPWAGPWGGPWGWPYAGPITQYASVPAWGVPSGISYAKQVSGKQRAQLWT